LAKLVSMEQPQHHAGALVTSRYRAGSETRDMFGDGTLHKVWGHWVASGGISRTGLDSDKEGVGSGYV